MRTPPRDGHLENVDARPLGRGARANFVPVTRAYFKLMVCTPQWPLAKKIWLSWRAIDEEPQPRVRTNWSNTGASPDNL